MKQDCAQFGMLLDPGKYYKIKNIILDTDVTLDFLNSYFSYYTPKTFKDNIKEIFSQKINNISTIFFFICERIHSNYS